MKPAQFFANIKESSDYRAFLSQQYPTPYLYLVSTKYNTVSNLEERRQIMYRDLDIDEQTEIWMDRTGICSIQLMSEIEYEESHQYIPTFPNAHTWSTWYILQALKLQKDPKQEQEANRHSKSNACGFRHFVGFKGGQGRSTLAATSAKYLATLGKKILIVEADIEAPSLRNMFAYEAQIKRPSTLIGIEGGLKPEPIKVWSKSGGGEIHLIPMRDTESSSDLEVFAFSNRCLVSPSTLFETGSRIGDFARQNGYHYVFVDHRAGINAFVPPLKASMPGPACVVLRPDRQSDQGLEAIRLLLRQGNAENESGWLICVDGFEEPIEDFQNRIRDQVERFIAIWPEAEEFRQYDSELLDSLVVYIPFSPYFKDALIPDFSRFTGESSWLSQLKEFCELSFDIDSVTSQRASQVHQSGAKSTDPFLSTHEFKTVCDNPSQNWYVFGRKGTGKTRFMKELATRNDAEPLLVPPEFVGSDCPTTEVLDRGIQVNSPTLERLLQKINSKAVEQIETALNKHYEKLFLFLIWLWLQQNRGVDRETLENALQTNVAHFDSLMTPDLVDMIAKSAYAIKARRCFMIDGLEMCFSLDQMPSAMNGLFLALLRIESQEILTKKIGFRVFLRADLVKLVTLQDLEKQLDKKKLDLTWSESSILNLFITQLSSVASTNDQGIGKYFGKFIDWARHEDNLVRLQNGEVGLDECLQKLTLIFPKKVTDDRSRPILLKNFLLNYFSDGSEGIEGEKAFYPRVFASFAQVLEDTLRTNRNKGSAVKQAIYRERIAPALPYQIHGIVSERFLDQVSQELQTTVRFSKATVKEFMQAFNGLSTPFKQDEIALEIATKISTGKPKRKDLDEVRLALRALKQLGVVEERPQDRSEWRASRLFKYALKMKWRR